MLEPGGRIDPDQREIMRRVKEARTMKATSFKIVTAGVAAVLFGVVMAAGSSSMPVRADLTIRHTAVGCHDWSVGNGAFAVAHMIVASEGQTITVTNRDSCGILLEQTAGPAEALTTGKVVEPLGKPVRFALHAPGVYHFTATDDDAADYVIGEAGQEFGLNRLPSIGADNVLTLTVKVLPSRTPAE
jgi:hypothetical protein